MITKWIESRDIWLYQSELDFRKQMNGLIAIIETHLNMPPHDGSIYLFTNRKRDKLKLLVWDRNGFILACKRLEKGKFDVGTTTHSQRNKHIEISLDQLTMLIAGMPIVWLGKDKEKQVEFS